MKEVITLFQKLQVGIRAPLGTDMSFGEFISLMEGQVKQEFFHKVFSNIKCGKRYLFSVKVVDADIDSYYDTLQETFEFKMFELEDDEIVTKPEEHIIRGLFR